MGLKQSGEPFKSREFSLASGSCQGCTHTGFEGESTEITSELLMKRGGLRAESDVLSRASKETGNLVLQSPGNELCQTQWARERTTSLR